MRGVIGSRGLLTARARGQLFEFISLLGRESLELFILFSGPFDGHFFVELNLPSLKRFNSDRRSAGLRFLRLYKVQWCSGGIGGPLV